MDASRAEAIIVPAGAGCGTNGGRSSSVRPYPELTGARRVSRPHSVPKFSLRGQVAERLHDPTTRHLVLTVERLGIDLQHDLDRVPGPLGDLGGWHSAAQPRQDGPSTSGPVAAVGAGS